MPQYCLEKKPFDLINLLAGVLNQICSFAIFIALWLDNEMVVTERACATNSVVAPGKHFDEGDPDDRLPTIDECLGADRVVAEEDAMTILEKVRNNKMTEWSCVYNLNKFTVDICLDTDYSNVYKIKAKDM